MGVERTCLKEASHLLIRSPKYWVLVGKLYSESLIFPQTAKVFRAAYFFCRHIDDVLDGDKTISVDPQDYVQSILSAIDNEQQGPPILELYRFAIEPIKQMALPTDHPEEDFKKVIKDAMLFDYKRAKEKKVLTREEIAQYYDNTFIPVGNIALIIAGSQQRAKDIPEVATTQGHIYTIRDRKKDIKQGVINIPQEILERSKVDIGSLSCGIMKTNSILSAWMYSEIFKYQEELKILKNKLSDEASKNVYYPLISQMSLYCKLYQLILHK